MARPSVFTQAVADAICERIEAGESLRAICKGETMPGYTTVGRWLDADEGFRAQYARARERQADTLAAEVIEIADAADTAENAQIARLRCDMRRWYASKLRPKVYGERVELEQTVRATITAEPLSEDEWSRLYGSRVAPPAGAAEGAG